MARKPREYCCCAIPLVNAGIYAVLTEQIVLALLVGTLSVATPSIVGAASPSFAAAIMAAVCYVAAAIQALGFFGVAKEKPTLFRRYVTLHGIITIAAFAIAITWTAMSAGRHSTAVSRCETQFFADGDNSNVSDLGQKLCDIFPWVSVGLMGGLVVALAISQLYFFIVLSSYGSAQRRDHVKYDSVYNPVNPATANSNIAMVDRNDPWNSRPSTDSVTGQQGYTHGRQQSATSMSDVLSEPQHQPKDTLNYSYGAYGDSSYPPQPARQATRQNSARTAITAPSNAHTNWDTPTPSYNNGFYSENNDNYVGDPSRPSNTQVHPAEGSFGRKTPRMNVNDSGGFGTGYRG